MKFPLANNNIEDYVTYNARGRELEALYKYQERQIATGSDQSLGSLLDNAIRSSTLGPFIFEFNTRVGTGPASVEAQQATLDLLKFSYCKAGEASVWDTSASIFPHLQYAVRFIEDALRENCLDGRITLDFVHKRLTCLNLNDRGITSLDEALASFSGLRYLNLAWNAIASTGQFLMPPHLYYLNLESNLLSDFVLPSQTAICHLTYLNLSRNRIADSANLSVLACLRHLLMLDLSHNELHTLDTLWTAVNTSRLRALNMIGNPCSVTADYLVNVIHHVPALLFLDHIPVTEEIKNEIQNKASSAGSYVFIEGAELRFHCYRVLRFKHEDAPPLPATPSKESLHDGKSKKKTTKRRKAAKKKSAKSLEQLPTVPMPPINVLYRVEIECPILNESLHKWVDFLAEAADDDAFVPHELLTRTPLVAPVENETIEEDTPQLIENKKSKSPKTKKTKKKNLQVVELIESKEPNESTPQLEQETEDTTLLKEDTGMTVREARELLTALRENGDINHVFPSGFVSNALPEAPLMEFSPIRIRAPNNNLKHLTNMFSTQVKIHLVQVQVLKKQPSKESLKVVKKRAKGAAAQPKSKADSTKTHSQKESKLAEPKIVGRTILHTILLDGLTEPTWADNWWDFVWTVTELRSAEHLRDLNYSTREREKEQEKKGAKYKQDTTKDEATPLPEELTIHFGVSLKRTHHPEAEVKK